MPVDPQSPWTAAQGDKEMSGQALSLLLFHWHLPPLAVSGRSPSGYGQSRAM